jgi:AmmeMemoRadiSam system protein A
MPQPSDQVLQSRFSEDQRRMLLERARYAICDTLCNDRLPNLPEVSGRLAEPGAVFVTLFCNGRLRGCIGHTHRDAPLADTVAQCAITAALHDPRFRPLRAAELAELEIEISALSEFEPIAPDAIEVGLHGILVTRENDRGLLLPQVAIRRNWSAERFLEEACRKAGLAVDSWKSAETRISAFTAEVFSEADLAITVGQPA